MSDEKQIRQLVETWADAVHRGDLDTVAADHSNDTVMFGVPPAVRGRPASRRTGRRHHSFPGEDWAAPGRPPVLQ